MLNIIFIILNLGEMSVKRGVNCLVDLGYNTLMKKIIIIAVIIVLAVIIYPKSYISSPGFVTPEANAEFMKTAKKCYGYSYLTNAEAMAADAPGESLCFGLLK